MKKHTYVVVMVLFTIATIAFILIKQYLAKDRVFDQERLAFRQDVEAYRMGTLLWARDESERLSSPYKRLLSDPQKARGSNILLADQTSIDAAVMPLNLKLEAKERFIEDKTPAPIIQAMENILMDLQILMDAPIESPNDLNASRKDFEFLKHNRRDVLRKVTDWNNELPPELRK